MALVSIICAHCAMRADKERAAVNRAQRCGAPVYCGRICYGLARRAWKSDDRRREEKAIYDMIRRAKMSEKIKAEKQQYHKRTYDPVKAAMQRKQNMPRHVEYCRRPEYRKYKQQYDRAYRADRDFGEFAESFLILDEINREILQRSTRYEIDLQNGKLCKSQRRKRHYTRIVGGESQNHAVGNPPGDQERRDASGTGRCHSGAGARNPADGQSAAADRRAVEALRPIGSDRIRRKGLSSTRNGGGDAQLDASASGAVLVSS